MIDTQYDNINRYLGGENDNKPAIRGFMVQLDEGRIRSKLWINSNRGNANILLRPGQRIYLDIDDYLCRACKITKKPLNKGYCIECRERSTSFMTRNNCIRGRPRSLLKHSNRRCTEAEPTCNMEENIEYCYSSYVLYYGRLGRYTKIGISRSNRRGGYYSRLLEQGFNEAIVVHSFDNIKEALTAEKMLKSRGYRDGIQGYEKVEALSGFGTTDFDRNTENHIFNKYFPEKDLEYISLHPEHRFEKPLVQGDYNIVSGEIISIKPPYLICKDANSNHLYYWNIYRLMHRELVQFEITKKQLKIIPLQLLP